MRESRQRLVEQIDKELKTRSSSQPATVHMGPSKRDTDHHWGSDRTVNMSQPRLFYQGHTRSKQSPAEKICVRYLKCKGKCHTAIRRDITRSGDRGVCNSSDKHLLAYQVAVHTNPKVSPEATA